MDVSRLANGNTLFTLKQLGIYEVDKAGKLVWKHEDDGVSHDADRLPNCNSLYVRGWVRKGEDHVHEVTPDRKLVWRWNGLARYDRKPFAGVEREGWTHANSVTRLANGNTLISLRNFNVFAEVNAAGEVVNETRYGGQRWADYLNIKAFLESKRGPVPAPHDPEVQPDGSILVALTGFNRVMWTAPGAPRPRWMKAWTREETFLIRDVNMLPNGNRLVTVGDSIIELDGSSRVVWQLSMRG